MDSEMKRLCYYINSDWYFLLHWKDRAHAAIKDGYEVHLICNVTGIENRKDLEEIGLIVHDCKMSEQSMNPFTFIKDVNNSVRLINEIKPLILHCITIKPCLIGSCFAKFKKTKLVVSFVGLGRVFSSKSYKYWLLRNFATFIYGLIAKQDGVCFIFEHDLDRDEIVNRTRMSVDKTLVINGAGIDIDNFSFKEEHANNVPIVLFASRVIWSKGLQDLIQAKLKLEKEGIIFNLNVAGITVKDDPDTIPESVLKKWQSEGTIKWLGKCNNVSELIEQANIIALPSIYAEGVPRILIEAASVGRATIAYNTGGCSSIILNNKTGYIINQKDIDALAEKIKILLLNPEIRKRFGYCARENVEKLFSSKIVVNATLDVYSRL